jgi:hypothetical protein
MPAKLVRMSLENLLRTIDDEITRLQQARALLAGPGTGTRDARAKASPAAKKIRRKRTMSADARQRIADAQRKRWAAQKKTPSKAG